MSEFLTLPTRPQEVYLPANCVSCSAAVEYMPPPGGALETFKLVCSFCRTRFLVQPSLHDPALSVPLPALSLPPEILSSVLAYRSLDRPTLLSASLVSHLWFECATRVLYTNIKQKWDSGMKSLTQTLDEQPALVPIVKSLHVAYPRLRDWVSSDLRAQFDREYRRVARLPGGRLPNVAAITEIEGTLRPKWLEAANRVGAGGWMDGGALGDGPRREGACALLELVRRCPRLERLTLDHFDFGGVPESVEDLQARLPTAIDNVVHLTLHHVPGDARDVVLSLLPHLKTLIVPELTHGASTFPVGNLANLQHVSFPKIIIRPHVEIASNLLDLCSASLRSLSLVLLFPTLEPLVPSLLTHAPSLTTLSLIIDEPHNARNHRPPAPLAYTPSAALLAYLPSTSLQHLETNYPVRDVFLGALPVTLQSFRSWIGAPSGDSVTRRAGRQAVVASVIAAKRSRLVSLNRCELVGQGQSGRHMEKVVEEAAREGVELVFKLK